MDVAFVRVKRRPPDQKVSSERKVPYRREEHCPAVPVHCVMSLHQPILTMTIQQCLLQGSVTGGLQNQQVVGESPCSTPSPKLLSDSLSGEP